MQLNFTSTSATLAHINTRKEGDDNNTVIAMDLKITAEVSVAVLDQLVPVDPEAFPASKLLFDGEGNPRLWAIEDFKIMGEHKEITAKLGRVNLNNTTAKKFKANVKHGGVVTLTFLLQLKPTHTQINSLVDMLQDEFKLTLTSKNQDMFSENAA